MHMIEGAKNVFFFLKYRNLSEHNPKAFSQPEL